LRVKIVGCRVQGSVFRIQSQGFRVQGAGFRVPGSGFRVQGSGIRVQGSGFQVEGSGIRVQGVGCRVSGQPRILETFPGAPCPLPPAKVVAAPEVNTCQLPNSTVNFDAASAGRRGVV